MAQVLSAFHFHPWSSTWLSLFDSTFSALCFFRFLLSVFFFLLRRTWQTCAAPRDVFNSTTASHFGSSRNPRRQAELARLSCQRFELFQAGSWSGLHEEAVEIVQPECAQVPWQRDESGEASKIGQAENPNGRSIQSQVMFDRAVSVPGTEDTFQSMQTRLLQVVVRELTPEVLDFQLEVPVFLDRQVLFRSLKTAPRHLDQEDAPMST